jgi:RNA polymerase sigma factor (sigma-70 family)
MAGRGLELVVKYLNRTAAVQQHGKLADSELLERFIRVRDSAAFEVLVWRHGAMVMNVCQRVTRCAQDAEDGVQATFMTLARKAHAIGHRGSVPGWLYKVAFRTALEVKRRAPRFDPEMEAPGSSNPLEEAIGRELQNVLDEEVLHLPEKYRTPLILSCFRGRTNREIADHLGCPEATVRTRLARGRERLRSRLDRRGMAVNESILALALTPPVTRTASAALVSSAIDFDLGCGPGAAGSVAAVWIARKVQHIMFLQTIKQCAAVAMLLAGLCGLTAFSVHHVLAARPDSQEQQEPTKKTEKKPGQIAEDRKALVGTWETSVMVTSYIPPAAAGQPSTSVQVPVTLRWAITPDKILSIDQDGFLEEEYDYKIDPEKHPKTIDIVSLRTGASLGIYELAGDRLKVSLGGRTERAEEFADTSAVYRRVSSEPVKVAQRYPSAAGCFWMIEPRSPGAMLATLGITYLYDTDKDGAAVLMLAYALPAKKGKPLHQYRPVLFDAEKKRYLPQAETGGASESPEGPTVSLQRWRMDPKVLPADKVARLGIESLTPESKRVSARDAAALAKQAGIEVLPWPELGKEYPLALTTIDGRKLSRGDFKGKVVVVDCWASWCAPCMAKMPGLKGMYEKWHKDGLEIVGVNLDQDVDLLRTICKKQGLSWPQVLAPTEPQAREIWQQAAGIEALPCILLIDREGKLRANTPDDLELEIGKLMGR